MYEIMKCREVQAQLDYTEVCLYVGAEKFCVSRLTRDQNVIL